MDALIGYDDEDPNIPGNEENPGVGVPIGSYLDKHFLSAISSFKMLTLLNDKNWVAWKGQISPMLKLNQVWKHCEGPEVASDLEMISD